MKKIKLGSTELNTAPIILGGNVFGWTIDEKQSFKILDEFIEKGFNCIDTANSYSHWAEGNSGGESEIIIGNWMKARRNRDKVNIFTKVGSNVGKEGRDVSEKHILEEVDKSLKRLQTDYIDLYFTHWDNENTAVEETLSAYDKIVRAGKVRHIGASNLSPERLKESLETSTKNNFRRYEVLQLEYNLFDREGFEKDYGPIREKENLALTTYYSLASGFLSGKYRSKEDYKKSIRGALVKKYLNERGKNILSALDNLSEKHKVSQAGIALAWLINNPHVTAPIASATKSKHIDSFVEASEVNLDAADFEQLDEVSSY